MKNTIIRCLSIVLLGTILLVAICPVVSASYFTDVQRQYVGEEIFDAINYMTDNGWMNGTSTSTFSPNDTLTRAMFVTILYRYSGSSELYAPTQFTDVNPGRYYYYAVGWAVHYGIVNGTSNTTFSPNTVIPLQQCITMLYRYALYEGKPIPTNLDSITCHPDYSLVSTYAITPIRWAKTFGILSLSNNNANINPQVEVSRGIAALFVARYAKRITGFNQNDTFNFINSDEYFYSTYYITPSTHNYLNSCIYYYYLSHGASGNHYIEDMNYVQNAIHSNWDGSCTGMVYSMFLDKIGKLDFNKNFGNNAANMHSVVPPAYNTTVGSAINSYQLINQLWPIRDAKISYWAEGIGFFDVMDDIYNCFHSYRAMPFGYGWDETDGTTSAHTILLTDLQRDATKKVYTLKYIDPNKTTPQTKTMIIGSSATTFNGKTITWLGYYPPSLFSILDSFDLDGAYNNNNNTQNNTSSVPNSSTAKSVTYIEETSGKPQRGNEDVETISIYIPYASFILENDEGEILICDGSKINGSMHVYEKYMIPHGEGHSAELNLHVAKSASYKYTPLNQKYTSIIVSGVEHSASLSGDSIEYIKINMVDRTITAKGNPKNYSATIETGIVNHVFAHLSGNWTGLLQIEAVENEVVVRESIGSMKYDARDEAGNEINVLTTKRGKDIILSFD